MSTNMEDIAKLREMTGAGMMDCKKALDEVNCDFDKAIDILRKKGAAIAAKRADRDAKEGIIVSYIHNGRIGAILELNSETDFVARNDDFKALAMDIVMHVVAAAPEYIAPENIPAEVIEKEKDIERTKLLDSGKTPDMIDKILEGKIEKFYSQVCLIKQPYVKNSDISIEDLLNDKMAAIGEKISIRRFVRYELGK